MGASTLSSRAIIGAFFARLEQVVAMSWAGKIAMGPFQSNQASETYAWLGMAPAMREWVGGRNAKGFRENGITIVNKKFEATLEVMVDEIRRDKTGQVMVRVNEMADRAASHWLKLLSDLLLTAESAVCYDGQYFFDTDHLEGDSGTQDNDLTMNITTATAPTAAEYEQAIVASIAQILAFKDDQGEPMNELAKAFLVMVPPTHMMSALAAVKNPQIVDGSGSRTNTLVNVNDFSIEIVTNPRLSSLTTKFMTFRTDGNVKPLIMQEEEDLTVSAVAEGSELEFNEDKHHYGIKAIRNVGFGYWQHACLTTFT
jgi:phage major head subunit gpT-like protein